MSKAAARRNPLRCAEVGPIYDQWTIAIATLRLVHPNIPHHTRMDPSWARRHQLMLRNGSDIAMRISSKTLRTGSRIDTAETKQYRKAWGHWHDGKR